MRYYWNIAPIPAINTWFPTGAPTFSTNIPCPKIRVPPNQALRCELFCQKSRLSRPPEAPIFVIIDCNIWVQSRIARKSNCLYPKIRIPLNYSFWFFIYRNPSAACLQQIQYIYFQSVHMLRWFCQRSRLSHRSQAPIFGKMSRFRQNPEVPIFGQISRFRQNPEASIFRKICYFKKFLNRQISGKIRGFVWNFRKI